MTAFWLRLSFVRALSISLSHQLTSQSIIILSLQLLFINLFIHSFIFLFNCSFSIYLFNFFCIYFSIYQLIYFQLIYFYIYLFLCWWFNFRLIKLTSVRIIFRTNCFIWRIRAHAQTMMQKRGLGCNTVYRVWEVFIWRKNQNNSYKLSICYKVCYFCVSNPLYNSLDQSSQYMSLSCKTCTLG